jgi:hypothetical protein
MNKKQIFLELSYFVLILYLFFEGISKIIFRSSFSMWLQRAPFLESFHVPLTFIIPLTELILSICLIIPVTRVKALTFVIILFTCHILWIITFQTFAKPFFFFPYVEFWDGPTWTEKILVSLILIGVGLFALLSSEKRLSYKKQCSTIAGSS